MVDMIDFNPKKISGAWRQGFALDWHTLSSQMVGHDQFGNPVYDTQRTEIGELLFRLKYRGFQGAVAQIGDAAERFMRSWAPRIDLLVPVPPSSEKRVRQPVIVLARELSQRLQIELCEGCVRKVKSTAELKNVLEYTRRLDILRDAFEVERKRVENRNILLFDDLYRSGATLNAITQALYNLGKANLVYVLTITKTRSLR